MEDLNKLTLKELKELCKNYNLKISGKKADLIERLLDRDSFYNFKLKKLRSLCQEKKLNTTGNKKDLIQRLIDFEETNLGIKNNNKKEMDNDLLLFELESEKRLNLILKNQEVSQLPPPLELTRDQKEKLKNLEIELKQKQEYDEKNHEKKLMLAEKSGIPYDVVDLDVIKFGTFIGLIKNKEIFEGKKKDESTSLISLLLGKKEEAIKIDFSKIPYHYKHATKYITEKQRIQMHSQIVQMQCKYIMNKIQQLITKNIQEINYKLIFTLEEKTLECYVNTSIEVLEILIETLENEDDPEIYENINLIRNKLIGFVNIFDYKNLLKNHIEKFTQFKKNRKKILDHLSWNDARLILYPGFQHRLGTYIESDILYDELEIRSFMKDPKLTIFNLNDIAKQCCVPSLISICIEDVVTSCLLNPYQNNSIIYLEIQTSKLNDPWAFYILKDIREDVRMWAADHRLIKTTEKISTMFKDYLFSTFRIFYKICFGDLTFRENCCLNSFCSQADIFRMLIRNICIVNNDNYFSDFLKRTIIGKSLLIPSQLDMFNSLRDMKNQIEILPQNSNYDIICNLFEITNEKDLVSYKKFFLEQVQNFIK